MGCETVSETVWAEEAVAQASNANRRQKIHFISSSSSRLLPSLRANKSNCWHNDMAWGFFPKPSPQREGKEPASTEGEGIPTKERKEQRKKGAEFSTKTN